MQTSKTTVQKPGPVTFYQKYIKLILSDSLVAHKSRMIFSISWIPVVTAAFLLTTSNAFVHIMKKHRHNQVESTDEHKHGFTPAPKILKPHRDICPENAVCVLPVQCPAHVHAEVKKKCKVIGGRQGLCCTTGQNHTDFVQTKSRHHHQFVTVDSTTLDAIARHSRAEVLHLQLKEAKLLASGKSVVLPIGNPSYGHFRNTRVFNMNDLSEIMDIASRALEIALATRAFKDRQGLTNQQLEWSLIQQDLRPTRLGHMCRHVPNCPPVPEHYRRIDGSCNNLLNPSWGSATSPYSRLLPPSYQDGVWAPRVSETNGQELPSPRLISTMLFPDEDYPNDDYTLLLMQFGQFISHDITQSIDASFPNGSAISCCSPDGSQSLPHQHYACMPIKIHPTDEFFGAYNQGCMNFVRSILAPRFDCTLGYAQQMNKITHFIDASSVYGSTEAQVGELRSFEGGRLRVFKDFGRDLLPLSKDSEACLTMEQGSACFESGDARINQMITLVALHMIFMREHNRLAGELERLNPYWTDEKLFLETRKILSAEMQVIVYKEFLPCILDDLTMEDFELVLSPGGTYSYDYDQRVEPSITNEFASAAFRYGHSMVNGLLKVYGKTKMEEVISIPEVMFYPSRMRKTEFFDEILSSLTTEPIQNVDHSMSDTLTKYMFRGGNPFGVDLASLNIQRGRDHGLRSFNDYRELIGLPRFKDFSQFGKEIGENLRKVYASIDDIDLWVGGLLEPKTSGSLLGPTFRDIVADQFSRLKKGDKYFFDHDPSVNPSYFTTDQLAELKKTSMSRLICDNSDGILLARQAPNAFKKPGVPGNDFVECSGPEIPRVNLIYWQE